LRNTALIAGSIALVLFALVLGLQGRSLFSQVLYTLLTVLPLGFGWFAVREYGLDSMHGRFFGLMLVGIGLWSIGEVLYFLFEWVFGVDPFPSVADFFYLAGYVPMFLAMKIQIAHVGLSSLFKNKKTLLFSTILLAFVCSIISYAGIYQAYSQEAGFWINAISIAYGIGDLFLVIGSLLTMMLLQAYRGGKITKVLFFLVIGYIATLIADVGFNLHYEAYSEGVRPYIYLDILWVAAYLCFLVAYSYAYNLAKAIRLQVTRMTSYAR
jgi:hypothetical protein